MRSLILILSYEFTKLIQINGLNKIQSVRILLDKNEK